MEIWLLIVVLLTMAGYGLSMLSLYDPFYKWFMVTFRGYKYVTFSEGKNYYNKPFTTIYKEGRVTYRFPRFDIGEVKWSPGDVSAEYCGTYNKVSYPR